MLGPDGVTSATTSPGFGPILPALKAMLLTTPKGASLSLFPCCHSRTERHPSSPPAQGSTISWLSGGPGLAPPFLLAGCSASTSSSQQLGQLLKGPTDTVEMKVQKGARRWV